MPGYLKLGPTHAVQSDDSRISDQIYTNRDYSHKKLNAKTDLFSSFKGGHHWQWSRRQIVPDPTVLQRNLHESIQEDDWRRFSGENHRVRLELRFLILKEHLKEASSQLDRKLNVRTHL